MSYKCLTWKAETKKTSLDRKSTNAAQCHFDGREKSFPDLWHALAMADLWLEACASLETLKTEVLYDIECR